MTRLFIQISKFIIIQFRKTWIEHHRLGEIEAESSHSGTLRQPKLHIPGKMLHEHTSNPAGQNKTRIPDKYYGKYLVYSASI